jgi:hypothetical protein
MGNSCLLLVLRAQIGGRVGDESVANAGAHHLQLSVHEAACASVFVFCCLPLVAWLNRVCCPQCCNLYSMRVIFQMTTALSQGPVQQHNHTHGVLLQLRALLELTSASISTATAELLLQQLDAPMAASLSRLGSPQCGCSTVQAAAVQILSCALALASSKGLLG